MIQKLHAFVWGPGMLALFLFTGVIYTVRLRDSRFCVFPGGGMPPLEACSGAVRISGIGISGTGKAGTRKTESPTLRQPARHWLRP